MSDDDVIRGVCIRGVWMTAEKEAFEVVYEKYFSDIYNYTYGQILHKERTEDLVSEIFLKAMTHYEDYDPSKASVRTWLSNIARNTIIDEFRRSAKRNMSSLDDENSVEPSFEEEYDVFQDAVNQEVRSVLGRLTQEERDLLGMVYFQKLKNDEIAQILGINAKAVSARHRRLLVKCRELEKGKDLSDFL